jgi:hypothetical protein
MISKVNANGNVPLHPALAGCIFKVHKQQDGGFVLKWKGRRIGGRMIKDAATRSLLRKLGHHWRAAPQSVPFASVSA